MNSSVEQTGRIKFYNSKAGFGFIIANNGKEYYFKTKGLTIDISHLTTETIVKFKLVQVKKGIEAVEIEILNS